MRKPDDFLEFLNQTKYQELVDSVYAELMLTKTELKAKFNDVETYAQGFIQQTKCVVQYFLQESDLMASIGTRNYLDRVYEGNELEFKPSKEAADKKPDCRRVSDLDFSLFCYEHLTSMVNREKLIMEKEDPLKLQELELVSDYFNNVVTTGLSKYTNSWQFYVLASYYWRLNGNAYEAMECARRAVYLAPASYRDIGLLSMGTILQRSRQHQDAVVVLEASTDFNPKSAENHFALGNSLIFLSEFNKSMQYYERSVHLDDAFSIRVAHIKNSLVCFKYVKSRLIKIQSILKEIPQLLQKYQDRKKSLEEYLEKMIAQQVPIADRIYSPPSKDNDANRGQFCSTRVSPETNEPVLFCDYASDIRMKLESEDISVELINTYLEQTHELIATHTGTVGIFDQLDEKNIGGQFENLELLYED